MLGVNAVSSENEPKPKSVKSIRGLKPTGGMADEKKLNKTK